ncbi:MAG: hypothetical protein [Caudoviricetes sp.]|nr:MAG: hypothetical protein [Caudoviricetes sp.]
MADKNYYLALIDRVALEEGLRPDLIPLMKRMVEIESGFRADPEENRDTARGIAQFTPQTARAKFLGGDGKYHRLIENGVDRRTDPEASLRQMARYLRTNDERFKRDWGLIVADYNAGYKDKYANSRNLPQETKNYLNKVVGLPGYQSNYYKKGENYTPIDESQYASKGQALGTGQQGMMSYAQLPTPQAPDFNQAQDKKDLQNQLDSYYTWLSTGNMKI